MKTQILVIDDDEKILKMLESILSRKNFKVITCSSGKEGLQKIEEHECDLILSDQSLSDMDGMELFLKSKEISPLVPFVFMTGYGNVQQAVDCLKQGAFDYLTKPFGRDSILKVIDKALEQSAQQFDKKKHNEKKEAFFEKIVGSSEKMQELFRLVSKIAPTNATVLIQGESGTGKELIAKAIHNLSTRKNEPFIAINCGVLSENLLENELFGHVKGAFTGATQYKKGLFEEADQGTLFLDEVADIPPAVQTKLLRVLQEKEFKPLGSNEIIKVNVRVIAASNINLYQAVVEKKFREDLYYRLAVIPIFVPPLRERKEDIPDLVHYFIQKYSKENGKNIVSILTAAMDRLIKHTWKGNVRELENTVERAVALASGNAITPDLLWKGMDILELETKDEPEEKESLKSIIHRDIKKAIIKALKICKGNRSKAAKLLGISRASFYNKLKECNE